MHIFLIILWLCSLSASLFIQKELFVLHGAISLFFIFMCAISSLVFGYQGQEEKKVLVKNIEVSKPNLGGFFALNYKNLLNIFEVCGCCLWMWMALSTVLSQTFFESYIQFGSYSLFALGYIFFRCHPNPHKLAFIAYIGFMFLLAIEAFLIPVYFFKYGTFTSFANTNLIGLNYSFGFLGSCAALYFLLNRSQLNTNVAAHKNYKNNKNTFNLVHIFYLEKIRLLLTFLGAFFLAVFCFAMLSFSSLGPFLSIVIAALFLRFLYTRKISSLALFFGAILSCALALFSIESGQVRLSMWLSSFQIFLDNFWLGTGIGTFLIHYPAYREGDFISSGLSTHNLSIQFALELGVFGVLMLWAFLGLLIYLSKEAISKFLQKNVQNTVPYLKALLASLCMFFALIIHAHISTTFNAPFFLILGGSLCGYISVLLRQALLGDKGAQVKSNIVIQSLELSSKKNNFAAFLKNGILKFFLFSSIPKYGVKGLILLSLVPVYIFISMTISLYLLQKEKQSLFAFDMVKAEKYLNGSHKLSFGQNSYTYLLASEKPIGILQSEKPFLNEEETQKLKDKANSLLEGALSKNPYFAPAYYKKAQLAELFGQEDEIEKNLLESLKRDPGFISSRLVLIRIYKRQRKQDQLLDLYVEGLKYPYRTPQAINFYKQAIEGFEKSGELELKKNAQDLLIDFKQDRGSGPLSTIF